MILPLGYGIDCKVELAIQFDSAKIIQYLKTAKYSENFLTKRSVNVF